MSVGLGLGVVFGHLFRHLFRFSIVCVFLVQLKTILRYLLLLCWV